MRTPVPSSTAAPTTRDPVTGLLNAPAFAAVLNHDLKRLARSGRPAWLIFVWLDRPLVELRGDEQLFVLVSRLLRRNVRGDDAICRIANSFLALLQNAGMHETRVVMRRIRSELRDSEGLTAAGAWSVEGTAVRPELSAEQLIKEATAPLPELARAVLPHGRRTWFARLASRR